MRVLTYVILFCVLLCLVSSGCGRGVQRFDRADMKDVEAAKAVELAREGKVDDAIEIYENVLVRDSGVARVHLELAMLLHEVKSDYIGALYHYKRYLLLRPDTEKREMIANRIKIAVRALAAEEIEGEAALGISNLERANLVLASRVMLLESELGEARRAESMLRERGRQPVPAKNMSVSVASNREGVRTHTVKGGDSLSSIAVEYYKDADKWKQVYEANRALLENSNELSVGQVLTIP